MAMSIGSCSFTVDASGNPSFSGSGLALALLQGRANALISVTSAELAADHSLNAPDTWAGVNAIAPRLSAMALADATAIVQHLQANAVAHVTNQSLGLTPNPNNANTAIQPPASPVDVPIQ